MPGALLLHSGHAVSWSAWHFEPTVIAGAVIIVGLYLRGLTLAGEAPNPLRVAAFGLGSLAIFVALTSPLDAAAHSLLSMHMLQHVVLTTIGPPLVLLGLSPAMLRPLTESGLMRRLLLTFTNPVVAGALFIINMWLWHTPSVYEAALTHLNLHVAMHIAFMGTGLLFWWPVVQPLPSLMRVGDGARLLYLFVTGFPMGLLALLLIASGSPVYDYYETAPRLWGMSALTDQQIAGVIMGALGEAASFVAITFLFFRFLDHEEAEAPVPAAKPLDAR